MELIFSKVGVLNDFSNDWIEKWVPSILTYCKALKKKDMKELLLSLEKGTSNLSLIVTFL